MSTPAAEQRATPDPATVSGESGIWIIVIGDIAAFLALFGMDLHYRASHGAIWRASQAQLTPAFGFVDTLLLLTSSLAVVLAVNAYRARRPDVAGRAFNAASFLGALFVVSKVIEWTTKAHAGHIPDRNAFFQLYFILTGLHLFHVLIGLFVLWLIRRIAIRPGPRPADAALITSGAIFWHMVDLLWVVLFALIFFVR